MMSPLVNPLSNQALCRIFLRRQVYYRYYNYYRQGKRAVSSTAVCYHQDKQRRPPFVVLGLPTTATTKQIKASFRRLALQHHPDLNNASDSNTDFTEIIHAYEQLMDQRGNSIGALTPGNTKLAWSCEISSIQELQDDSRLEIHPIWLRYENDDGDNGTDCPKKDASPSGTHLDHAVSISIHPDSSVTDLKHELLMLYDKRWNLESRRKDRYCLPIGWELVTAYSSDSCDRSSSSSTSKTLTVLGNHDFVKHTYNIPSDTIMYAVIQK